MRANMSLHSVVAVLALALAGPAPGAQTCKDNIPKTAPDSRYTTDNGTNGTVTDEHTGLTWKRCSEGQTWDDSGCDGDAATYTWQEALQRAQAVNDGTAGNNLGHNDWRLPNKNELASLVERACHSPAINATIFPGTATSLYWSASLYANNSYDAWGVRFDIGAVNGRSKHDDYGYLSVRGGVRLVRGGQ